MLLVDDEPGLLELAKLFLDKNDDLATLSASSVKDALRLMQSADIDAVVCDYQMPDMDGLEFLKLLRAEGNEVPFVLFTGRGREDVAIQALNSGADFYLQKGGDPRSQFAELANMIRASVAAIRSKRELATSEERFRLLAENSEDMIYRFVILPEQHFEYVSPACERIFGWTPEELYANPMLGTEIVHPDDRHHMLELVAGTLDLSEPLKVRGLRKDGSTLWIELRIVPFRDEKGRLAAIEGTVLDIDNRVRAERELRDSEAQYRSIFETVASAMVIVDEQGVIQSVNPAYEKISGYAKDEIEGKKNWASFFDPEHVRRMVEEYASTVHVGNAPRMGYPFRVKDRFGKELALVAYTALIPGTKKMVVSMIDETERMRFEDTMRQTGRKMDLLANITRHDVMNQLSALFGYLELAQERSTDPDQRAMLARARAASESIRRHLEFARDYQNMGRKKPQWIDLQKACRRAASNAQAKDVKVLTELEGLEVFSDQMLEKVFYNLIDNALRHGEKTSMITFRYLNADDGLVLICEDDGIGVPDPEKSKIFGQTATDYGETRGYGLYLAREILSITGITLTETGEFGRGARFEMHVPKGMYRIKARPIRKKHAKGKREP